MLTDVARTVRSETIKLRRWSVLSGGAAMIAVTILFDYLFINRAASANDRTLPLGEALPTTHGLLTVVGAARPFVNAIAIIVVAASVASEWSQGTLRNLLVRQPDRLRLLAGKLLALLLFVAVSAALAMLFGAAVVLVTAQSKGISTAPWTSSEGVSNFFNFFGNGVLGTVGASLLGVVIALLTRSVAAAVGIALAWVLVAESLLDLVWPDGAQWFPVHIFGYLPGVASPMNFGLPPMGYGAALLVAMLWMAGFLAVGFTVFRRMDVTS
jgi:ABC-2 type transport system permease protein